MDSIFFTSLLNFTTFTVILNSYVLVNASYWNLKYFVISFVD